MKRTSPALGGMAAAAILVGLIALPASAGQHASPRGGASSGGGQRSGGGASGGGGQQSGGSASAGGGQRSGGGASAGGGQRSGGGARQPVSGGGHAVPKGSGGAAGGNASDGTTSGTNSGTSAVKGPTSSTSSSHSPDGTAVARAVRRTPVTPATSGSTIFIPNGYYGGFYPWGYGGYGFGGYNSGYYDPWFSGGYGYPRSSYSDDGALKIKVKPRDATVYVDGYYAGHVDDFDGVFQRLRIEPGPHRIEIQADGYETLEFDVRLESGRTVTYSGSLQREP